MYIAKEHTVLNGRNNKEFFFKKESTSIQNLIFEMNNYLGEKYHIDAMKLAIEMQINRMNLLMPVINKFFTEAKKNEYFAAELLKVSNTYSVKSISAESFQKIIAKKITSNLNFENSIDCSDIFYDFASNDSKEQLLESVTIDFDYTYSLNLLQESSPVIYSYLKENGLDTLFLGERKPSSLVLIMANRLN